MRVRQASIACLTISESTALTTRRRAEVDTRPTVQLISNHSRKTERLAFARSWAAPPPGECALVASRLTVEQQRLVLVERHLADGMPFEEEVVLPAVRAEPVAHPPAP